MYYLAETSEVKTWQEEFEAWHAEINQLKGYPNDTIKTYRYTDSMPNNNDTKGCWFVNDADIPDNLKRQSYDREQLIQEGFTQFTERI